MFYLILTKISLKTPLKTLKYPFSYTEYLHTKWRQLSNVITYNNVRDARNVFVNKRIGEMISQGRKYFHM